MQSYNYIDCSSYVVCKIRVQMLGIVRLRVETMRKGTKINIMKFQHKAHKNGPATTLGTHRIIALT
jgi:hypothetical protein